MIARPHILSEWLRLLAQAPNIGVGELEAKILAKRGVIDPRSWCRIDAMVRRELPDVGDQETVLNYLDQVATGRRK